MNFKEFLAISMTVATYYTKINDVFIIYPSSIILCCLYLIFYVNQYLTVSFHANSGKVHANSANTMSLSKVNFTSRIEPMKSLFKMK